MKNSILRLLCFALALTMTLVFCSCGKTESETEEKEEAVNVTFAYQGGISYAPIHVMEAKKLLEKNYDGEITTTFQKLDSGADINTGIIGGTIDVGCMGVPPAVSAIASGSIDGKIISGLSAQGVGLMTNGITSLKDITEDTRIALVNTGSIQHIILAMAAKEELGDAHALDNNIVPMAHADAMAALESGTVDMHLAYLPHLALEKATGKYKEIESVKNVWTDDSTFIVAFASTKLQQNTKLYEAITKSISEAIDFINNNQEEVAKIEAEYLDLDEETALSYLQDPACQYSADLNGVEKLATFMYDEGFIDKKVTLDDIKFDNVKGN